MLATVVAPAVNVHVIVSFHATDMFAPAVMSHVVSIVVDSTACVSTSARVDLPATCRVQSISAFHDVFRFSFTVKSPVIVTSHKYQAKAEKSPLISVPLDNTKVYSPSNGSESGFVSLIDSSLTSLY